MKLLNEGTSVATSIEANGSKLTSMQVGGSFHGNLFTSVEAGGITFHGNFRGSNLLRWK